MQVDLQAVGHRLGQEQRVLKNVQRCRVQFKHVFGIFSILTVTTLAGLGCSMSEQGLQSPTAIPTPTPTPMPGKVLHDRLLAETVDNPTRLKNRVENRQLIRFTIQISSIEDSRIRQYFNGNSGSYIECEFKHERSVLNLNRGQTVNVYGFLDEAFDKKFMRPDSNSIKFRDCGFLN